MYILVYVYIVLYGIRRWSEEDSLLILYFYFYVLHDFFTVPTPWQQMCLDTRVSLC